ncbi:MAG: hypothetical protein HYW49_02895 [Deltaproteobacteria bacterium]|nr:hypothetical protein [Deltaproteobacteria bacterium]
MNRVLALFAWALLFGAAAHAQGAAAPTCTTSKCHADLTTAAVVHEPVKSGDCDSCHSRDTTKKAKPAIGHPALVRIQSRKISAVCLPCHDGIENTLKTSPHKHPPVSDCTGCHQPHSSPNRALLKEPFTDKIHVEFDEKLFALCFQCHTLDETQFRNGEKNLHFFHLQDKGKGRSCRACHEPHASANPKLIRQWMPYQGLLLPIRFEATKTGGRCAAACHGAKRYDRVKAIANEAGR